MSRARRPLVVELAGIPGAGKSFLSVAVSAGLTDRGLVVAGPDPSVGPGTGRVGRLARKCAASVTVGLHAPRSALRVAGALLRSGQPGVRDLVARMVQWQVAQDQLRGSGGGADVLLVDEGLVQCLWSIGLRGDVEPVLHVLRDLPGWRSPDVLVLVRTAPAVAAARLTGRVSQHSRTQRLPAQSQLAELERGERLLDRLVEWWASTAGDPDSVLEVTGSGATDERVGSVARRTAEAVGLG